MSGKRETQPVFIVGLPRTGTSIMYRTIQKLPNFQAKRINLWETSIFRQKISFEDPDLHYPSLLGYMDNHRETYDAFLEEIKPYTDRLRGRPDTGDYDLNIRRPPKFPGKILQGLRLGGQQKKWLNSAKHHIIQVFFRTVRNRRQCARLVEKTPHHYFNVHQILWTFPQAHVVWMIRHPVDIFTSAAKRAQKDKNYRNYWNIDNFVKEYQRSFLYFDYYRALFKNRLIMVKYEDFAANPGEELQKICKFLDESYSPQALELTASEAFKWAPDPHLTSKIVTQTEKKWQDYLTGAQAREIESRLKDEMEKYRFTPYSSPT